VFHSTILGSLSHISSLIENKAQAKIIQLLKYLVLRFGEQVDETWMAVSIRLTQNDLSDLLGITRETVAVELGKLKNQNIVEHSSFTYRINVKALTDFVDESLWDSFRAVEAKS